MLEDSQIIKKIDKYKVECECAQCGEIYVVNKYDARKSTVGHLCHSCSHHISKMKLITQETLLEAFAYDRGTGEVTYRKDSRSGLAGSPAGYPHSEGYMSVGIGGKEYLLHRVIWFMETGKWPDQVDHIDHNRSNNRWLNLREVQSRENQLNTSKSSNNSSGHTGVRKLPSGRWHSYIMVHRKQVSLGTFDQIEDAIAARTAAEQQYGFHANHGT